MSMWKTKTTILLASALLCSTPGVAALKAKSSTTRVKARTVGPVLVGPVLKPSSSSSLARTSSKSSSHKSSKSIKSIAASTHKGHKESASAPVQQIQVAKVSKPKFHGQQSIDEARTLEIQQALIREHYLGGEATGEWDQSTRDALTRFQGDNHWQTKILPDARALIKLGLGPHQQNLLNPESAAIAIPYQPGKDKFNSGGLN
jgi:hypothetical protein